MMTDESTKMIEKEIDKRSAEFQEVWRRTPPINRAIFNDRLKKIEVSCHRIHLMRKMSAETEESRLELVKTRKYNAIIFISFVIIINVIANVDMFQTDYYKNMSELGKSAGFYFLWIMVFSITVIRELSSWLTYYIKSNSLQNARINSTIDSKVNYKSSLYGWIMYDTDDEIANKESRSAYSNYILAITNLLYEINRSQEDDFYL